MSKLGIYISIISVTGILSILFFMIPYKPTETKIENHLVFKKPQGLCEAYYEIILYETEEYQYNTAYSGCNSDPYLYIFKGFKFISIKDAIEDGIIKPESLEGKVRKRDKTERNE